MPHLEERGARLELLDDHARGGEHGEAAVLEPARNRPGESRNEFSHRAATRERDTQPQHTNKSSLSSSRDRRDRQTTTTNKQHMATPSTRHTQTTGTVVFDAARDSLVCISLSASGSSGLRPRGSKSCARNRPGESRDEFSLSPSRDKQTTSSRRRHHNTQQTTCDPRHRCDTSHAESQHTRNHNNTQTNTAQ